MYRGGPRRNTPSCEKENCLNDHKSAANTRIDEIEAGVLRISTPTTVFPGGFTFNQYLVKADEPLVFHTGPRALFAPVAEAIAAVTSVESLRWTAFSHVEATSAAGSTSSWLARPRHRDLQPGRRDGSVNDLAARTRAGTGGWRSLEPAVEADAVDRCSPSAPRVGLRIHVRRGHGDPPRRRSFTQPGAEHPSIAEGDILGPSEAMRAQVDYFTHSPASIGRRPEAWQGLPEGDRHSMGC